LTQGDLFEQRQIKSCQGRHFSWCTNRDSPGEQMTSPWGRPISDVRGWQLNFFPA